MYFNFFSLNYQLLRFFAVARFDKVTQSKMCSAFQGISDGPSVSALTNGFDTPEERYQKLKKVKCLSWLKLKCWRKVRCPYFRMETLYGNITEICKMNYLGQVACFIVPANTRFGECCIKFSEVVTDMIPHTSVSRCVEFVTRWWVCSNLSVQRGTG